MATFFTMPKLGLNMTEGRIVNWLAKEGAHVKTGQPIIEIETDKATNEVEAPATGVIGKILHHEGEDVPCNGVLAVILSEGEISARSNSGNGWRRCRPDFRSFCQTRGSCSLKHLPGSSRPPSAGASAFPLPQENWLMSWVWIFPK